MESVQRFFANNRVWRLLHSLQQQFVSNHCADSAAALTLATLFALVPFIAVSYQALALLPAAQELGQRIENWLFAHLLPATSHEVKDYLSQFAHQAQQLTPLGLLLLLVTALLMLQRIQKIFNRIWQADKPKRTWQGHVTYWLVLGVSPLLVVFGLAMTSYLLSWNLLSLASLPFVLQLLPLLASTLGFALMNKMMPNTEVSWAAAWIGGGFTALAFELAKYGFAFFVHYSSNYQLIYGAFAALPLLIMWIYLSWMMVLVGALLTRTANDYV
jgi:membrane protein